MGADGWRACGFARTIVRKNRMTLVIGKIGYADRTR